MNAKSDVLTEGTGVTEAMETLSTRSGLEMVFVARRLPSHAAVQVTWTYGARTGTMSNLVVHCGAGLGGKALLLNRPLAVSSYKIADGITHDYDAQVLGEGLETLAAFPPVLSGSPDIMIYLGNRSRVSLGERWYEQLRPWVQNLVHTVASPNRPSDRQTTPKTTVSDRELTFLLHEIEEIVAEMDSSRLSMRLMQVHARLDRALPNPSPMNPVDLTRREIDVLRKAALGLTNSAIGEKLGLRENSVKTYLRTAMRKLSVTNRVQAIIAAQALGLIS